MRQNAQPFSGSEPLEAELPENGDDATGALQAAPLQATDAAPARTAQRLSPGPRPNQSPSLPTLPGASAPTANGAKTLSPLPAGPTLPNGQGSGPVSARSIDPTGAVGLAQDANRLRESLSQGADLSGIAAMGLQYGALAAKQAVFDPALIAMFTDFTFLSGIGVHVYAFFSVNRTPGFAPLTLWNWILIGLYDILLGLILVLWFMQLFLLVCMLQPTACGIPVFTQIGRAASSALGF
jgi:hypothetical protein